MKLNRFLTTLLIFFSLAVSAFSQTNSPLMKSFHAISSHDLLRYADELSAAKYRGRLSGSPGYEAAARWVASELKASGVQPLLPDSGWLQWFPNAYTEVLSPGSLEMLPSKGEKGKKYNFPDDYFPGSNSASGKVSGEVVYAGYGITAPELGYDDYAGIDVKGKILLIENGTPYTRNDTALLRWEPYSYHRYKFKRAKEAGATAILYVGRVANPNTSYLDNFLTAHIDEKVADDLLSGAGKLYADLRKQIAERMKPISFALGRKIRLTASTLHFPDSRSCNVIGFIEGSDPVLKHEAIIVGAHLDAVGHPGALFPGALDNGSGSADILAAAKALAASEVRPARSIIFLFFGGEECGLYGSKKWVDENLWPKEKVLCMINLDMVGNGTGFHLANGKSYPELFAPFAEANEKYIHRELGSSEFRVNYGRPRTDGAVFDKAGYRTLSLYTTGTVKPVYYHHPLDNSDVLTPEIMEDAAKLLYLGILETANRRELSTLLLPSKQEAFITYPKNLLP